ncbi:MAG: bifunctional riboflavin kinase/FAD synthetase [Dehalobacterium sp.]
MKVITGLEKFPQEPNFVAVALGNFDGVHRGHQILISQLVENAHQEKGLGVVFTFNPHPLSVLGKKDKLLLLNTPEDKEKHISKLGVDVFIPFPFNRNVADMTPDAFVTEILIKGLRAKTIFVGYNFTFGRKAMGDPKLLKSICQRYDCQVKVIPEVKHKNIHISSTNIREFILNGNVAMANLFLGYPYNLVGTVVPGNQLGRKLGFPTANLKVTGGLVIPENGVYAVKVQVDQNLYPGVANIGKRPTIGSDLPQSIEIHIFDQELNLYDKEIRVFFFERLRAEKKFSDVTELTCQVNSDISAAKLYLKNINDLQVVDLA